MIEQGFKFVLVSSDIKLTTVGRTENGHPMIVSLKDAMTTTKML